MLQIEARGSCQGSSLEARSKRLAAKDSIKSTLRSIGILQIQAPSKHHFERALSRVLSFHLIPKSLSVNDMTNYNLSRWLLAYKVDQNSKSLSNFFTQLIVFDLPTSNASFGFLLVEGNYCQLLMVRFVPRDRKKRRRRVENSQNGGDLDTNAVEVIPATTSEKDQKKKEIKDSIRAQQPAMSSKKAKRLDKYIVRR